MASKGHPFLSQLTALTQPDYHHILIYGPPRSGKTTFLGSCAFDERTAPILILDFDQGRTSLVGLPKERIVVARCTTWDDLSQAFDYLSTQDHPFKAVAVDSLTKIHIYSLASMSQKAYARSRKDRTKAERLAEEDAQRQDYNLSLNQMRQFVYKFLGLPMHVIMTAHSKETLTATSSQGDGGGYIRLPNMFGQFAEEVVGIFDTVTYLSVERPQKGVKSPVQRLLILQNYPEFRTGVRTPWDVKIPNKVRISKEKGATILLDTIEGVIKESEGHKKLKDSDQSGNPIED